MSYPQELLPKYNYKSNIEVERLLLSHPSASLLRKSADGADLSDLKVRDVFPNRGSLYGFSTYFFGEFLNDHIKYKTKTRTYWKEGDACLKSKDVKYTNESSLVFPLYFKLKDCHELKIPLKKTENKLTQTVMSTLLVKHRPMLDNYWHFEFVVFDESGTEIDSSNLKEYHKKSALEFVEDQIMTLVDTNDASANKIQNPLYKKSPFQSFKALIESRFMYILAQIKDSFR
ncbi:hypothetical protein [Ohtaekwangia koreensis]|uniref:Uncharacterized protein n=1 Tax=Ohtaekwangia koreensis TaxID=688867 RepID=A0A1T5LC12_9BACT|nr:hypothetical protein [Ohtaekwangia koreensis]SKC73587.1 hypothetical protein SAMN05660236_2949 [Ohtaekwangia koreensis]